MLRIVLIFNKNLTNKKIVGMHSIFCIFTTKSIEYAVYTIKIKCFYVFQITFCFLERGKS